LIETITHLAFYSGWPSAVIAISGATEVFQTRWRRAPRALPFSIVLAIRSRTGHATSAERCWPWTAPTWPV